VSNDKTDIIFWASDTHEGSIKYYDADGVLPDLCAWVDATETKTGRAEHTIPYANQEAALRRLVEKYDGFHVTDEPDALAGK
jgi:hypothetical protein